MAADLVADPIRISAHHDLPFAIVCYSATEEMQARKLIRLTAAKITETGKRKIHFLSLARLLWDALESDQDMEKLYAHERQWGFRRLEERLFKMLASPKFIGIEQRLAAALNQYDPASDAVFIVRASVLSPRLFRVSALLEGLYRKTMVPAILFYPGIYEGGSSLRYMNLPGDSHLASPQYRVNIYGNEK